ncbi:MAG TPA: sigma-54 dependent transcriptional regulator, partial [Polyangiaceae bacterium LLY-WYZ-15_(1-7)]|nr:sigma-54 dependent transcriptional regulator [Polyangiaceae bacterium LLY-WYZ-15_(1-7)]
MAAPDTDGVVILVEDDPDLRLLTTRWLEKAGWDVEPVESGEALFDVLPTTIPDCVCLDLGLPGMSGMETLHRLRRTHPRLPVVILTADREVDTVVEAMQGGAYDYLPKPLDRTRLETVVRNAVERHGMALKIAGLEQASTTTDEYAGMLGRSPVMRALFRQVDRVASSEVTVLLRGESGAGKELVARAIHDQGPRARGPFVALNCAAVAETLQEAELFGHEKGAFTGADRRRAGRFEQADGGTLFLDEVAELSASLQAKLLRVLQERSFHRIGGAEEIRVDIRIVAASHRDLASEVAAGRFREDLFFRLAVFEMDVPPLRARGDDVLLLARRFLAQHGGEPPPRLDDAVVALFRRHRWPGNVRELENAVQRALVVCRDGLVRLEDLPPRIREAAAAGTDGPGEEPGAPAGAGAEGAGGPL